MRPHRPRSERRQRTPRAILGAALLAAAGACGGSELEVEPTFDGTWTVARLEVDGVETELDRAALVIEIDTAETALRGSTGCGRLFGSYTLVQVDNEFEGAASFTVPSRLPDDSCPAVDRARHEALVGALESVTRWRRDPESLVLTDDPQTAVELRPAG